MDDRLEMILTRGSRAESSDADLARLESVREQMWELVVPVIAARRASPENDAISRILEKQDEVGKEELSDDVFLNMLLELVAGGFETTQHLIEMLLSHLADHPDLWARLGDDRSLIPKAIEEMLRWRSPVQALGRRATEDIVLHGVTIPANSWVTVTYGSANRDEREFDEPDSYDVDRELRRHVAFSAGIHYCPGAPVSRAETRLLLEELLDRYRTVERAGPSLPSPNPMPGKPGKILGWRQVPVHFAR
jgi:cytochrome P450